MKLSKKSGKARTLFHPTPIVTTLELAVMRDLAGIKHVYDQGQYPHTFYQSAQKSAFRKKYVDPGVNQDHLESVAFEKFNEVNLHMADFRELSFPNPSMRIQTGTSTRDRVLLRARALAHQVLGSFSFEEWLTETKHSSGSSIGVPFVDTSIERKFQFPITMTERVKPLFDKYLDFDLELKSAIEEFNGDHPVGDWYNIVDGSRATTVEKNDKIRRMIAVEPTANMFLQQGLMTMMYQRMAKFGLNVKSLPARHRKLAQTSSITGLNATIDWSSASDCVSIGLLRWLIPPKWFSAIDQTRSNRMSIKGNLTELNMISTMGNAVTFPAETLIFWSIAQACNLTSKVLTNSLFPEWDELKECSVFGDDCIVPTGIAEFFIEFMTSVGFLINDDKSFYGNERFRESCGGDYLLGHDVRPFFLRAPTSTNKSALEPWLYIIANSLYKKYKTYFGELNYLYDKDLWRELFSLFRKNKIEIKLVPDHFPDDSGLKMSEDIERLVQCYSTKLSKVAVSEHGTYSFLFVRFQFKESRSRHDGIRYATWLKSPGVSEPRQVMSVIRKDLAFSNKAQAEPEEEREKRYQRKVGGYVVGKGISCQWQVPRLVSRGQT